MRASRTSGSVRGAGSNPRPYRDPLGRHAAALSSLPIRKIYGREQILCDCPEINEAESDDLS